MDYLKQILLVTTALSVSGCAGVVTAFKNDPLQHYNVSGPTIYAMTGDRRTAVMVDPRSTFRFCAESLPDAVAAYSASSKARLGVTGRGDAELADTITAGLLQTFQRTEIAEVYRQMGWNTCLAWAQRGITDAQYFELLSKMVDRGMSAIETRAGQTQVMQSIPSATLVVAGPPIPMAAPPPPPPPPSTPTPKPPSPPPPNPNQ